MMDEAAKLAFKWGDQNISFDVTRSDRHKLKITVAPDGIVHVQAPHKAGEEEIIQRTARRGGWIVRQLLDFERWRPRTPPRQYVSGETHLLQGKQYRLLVIVAERPDVYLNGERIVMAAPEDSSFNYRRALLSHWYGIQCHRIFPERLDTTFPPFARLGIERPRLIIRDMTKRWGSYTPRGSLVLNRELVCASPQAIDYVIAHELAHVLHPDHSPAWRRLITLIMPDWQERKRRLEGQLL